MTINQIREILGDFLYRRDINRKNLDLTIEMPQDMMESFRDSVIADIKSAGFELKSQPDVPLEGVFNPMGDYNFGTIRTKINNERFAIYHTSDYDKCKPNFKNKGTLKETTTFRVFGTDYTIPAGCNLPIHVKLDGGANFYFTSQEEVDEAGYREKEVQNGTQMA